MCEKFFIASIYALISLSIYLYPFTHIHIHIVVRLGFRLVFPTKSWSVFSLTTKVCLAFSRKIETWTIFTGTLYWLGERYWQIHIEKGAFRVISVNDIKRKRHLCLMVPQRFKRLPAVTAGFISPPSTTNINPNLLFHMIWLNNCV